MKKLIVILGLIALISCEKAEPKLVNKCDVIESRVVGEYYYYRMSNGDEVMVSNWHELQRNEVGDAYCYTIME